MLKIIKQDILKVKSGIICHQVNCKGVMGAGLAKQIKNKWPLVYVEYLKFISKYPSPICLGSFQSYQVDNDLIICNIFGQIGYGKGIHTCYDQVDEAFEKFKDNSVYSFTGEDAWKVYVPYMMGCGLAGGDWKIYSAIIERYFPQAIVCKL
jgi:O-acetyl-ADP-ribose deacetylase (regulator of RNase III)